jgi:eukaryotic-like serine/threonine-protein kinase
MSLATGSRLGPYEVLAPIGAGGMGEVYRARDTRLGREVAIKVLPDSYASDPERLKRFEHEARAASALNHPNILTVFDIGTHERSPYLVSELLEGATLRERLDRNALSPRKAQDCGAQIARGLAAAHDKGIVHRDLKPENLLITSDGRAKILDFGLARLSQPVSGADARSDLPTASSPTEAGTVMGTVGYMSPEQVRGETVDHRSDIFSFGAVLYETLSGERAFKRATPADTMAAILKEDPPDLSGPDSVAPSRALDRIVMRCLEKAPGERFQSARDLAFALEALSGFSGPVAAGALAASTSGRRRSLAIAAGSALLLALLAFFAGRRSQERRPLSSKELTFRRGYLAGARFAPDGKTVVYGAAWDGGPVELYSTRAEGSESRPLGLPPAGMFAISSSGMMAISLGCHVGLNFCVGTLAEAPLGGGAPREILENVFGADWSPDGKQLAVAHRVGERWRLEFPVGTVLYQAAGPLVHPRISPKGDKIAFVELPTADPFGSVPGSVSIVDRNGVRRVLTAGFKWGAPLSWSPDGSEIWFSGNREGVNAIRAVDLGGRERIVYSGIARPGAIVDISAQGSALVTLGQGRNEIVALAPGETSERNLSWFDWSVPQDLSEDGRTLLFDERGGVDGVFKTYLRKTDGSAAIRLGEGRGRSLSPDGKWALVLASSHQMVIVPTGAGASRTLPAGTIDDYESATWFPDGRHMLLSARERGRPWRCFVQDKEGGEPAAVTPEGIEGSLLSPDGRFVVAGDSHWALHSLAGGPPRPISGIIDDDEPLRWTADARGLFVARRERARVQIIRVDVTTGKREAWRDLGPADTAGLVSVSDHPLLTPDGRVYVFAYTRSLNALYLVDGLH